MKTNEIRQLFLDFFAKKDHLVLPSFSLIPQKDPSLLLIGAGMAPLKSYFTGQEAPPHNRIATCQKCVRTPDIERVGRTARHATFFEMLGNFSFGDYFKEEAICWAWEFVTEVLGLPTDRLYSSVYQDDDEAFTIWNKKIGLSPERIIRLGKKDNFWEIGTGPCGPCSEIYYDLGEEEGCGSPDCKVGCECDRFLEIWNLVFTQFNRQEDGTYIPLEQKNIDTGAGLERIAVVMQGVKNLFEIDIVKPLLDFFVSLTDVTPGIDNSQDVSLKIITEHFRGVSFMIGDGILPSNEGRGYVLRRLLRRAIRHGKLLGIEDSFMHKAVPLLVNIMGDAYPDLVQRQAYIVQVIKLEEERFLATLDAGTQMLEEHVCQLKELKSNTLAGKVAFRLYDTFGFPLDMTREILEENNFTVDEDGFNSAMEEQREKARSARTQKLEKSEDNSIYEEIKDLDTYFTGYDIFTSRGKVQALLSEEKVLTEATAGTEVLIVMDSTPFYAEKGGQTGDTGILSSDGITVSINDTLLSPFGQVLHQGCVEAGTLKTGMELTAEIDVAKRRKIMAHHTATHLLHRALKAVLGEHVNQGGSLVAPYRLRFDFNHFGPVTSEETEEIENIVNEKIWLNLPVTVELSSYRQALQEGAVAIFEEKYGEEVRVVKIGDYSRELCAGTHVTAIGELGLFKIVSESGIGAGLRRIEAVTGTVAYSYFREKVKILEDAAKTLKTSPEFLVNRTTEILEELKKRQKESQQLADKLSAKGVDSLLKEVVRDNGLAVLSAHLPDQGMDSLRTTADYLKERLGSGIIVLGSVLNDKVQLVAVVTKDLVGQGYHAGKILHEIAKITGGGGGGRPDLAQAGGRDKTKLPLALASVQEIVGRGREVKSGESPGG